MCNNYANRVAWTGYVEAFAAIRLPIRLPEAAPNLEPRDNIWPTDRAPILRRHEDGVELAQLSWGFPPGRPKAPPIINFRSEGRRFAQGRCLVPASHFYEYTGAKSPKAKWKLALVGEDFLCFAGLWRSARGDADGREMPAAFTLLTTAPGPDVAPLHDRQPVILERRDWAAWLDLSRPETDLLRPLPAGRLSVAPVRATATLDL